MLRLVLGRSDVRTYLMRPEITHGLSQEAKSVPIDRFVRVVVEVERDVLIHGAGSSVLTLV